jgi:hypothetical protein
MKTQSSTCLCAKHITRISVYYLPDYNIRWSGHIDCFTFIAGTRIIPKSVGWESEQKLWTLSYSRSISALSLCHWHRNVCHWHRVWSIHNEQGGKSLPKTACQNGGLHAKCEITSVSAIIFFPSLPFSSSHIM